VAVKDFVNGVVNRLHQNVVEAIEAVVADIHPWQPPDSFQSL
jgi:hypothetical protein